MVKTALLKKQTTQHKSIKSSPGQPSVTTDRIPSTTSAEDVLQLQQSAGNRVVQALFGRGAKDTAAVADGGSAAIISWFKSEAAKEKKERLYGYFEALSPFEQKMAINLFAGRSGVPTLGKVKKNLTGFFSSSIDWDKFSTVIRGVKGKDTKNYNEDTDRDYVTYAAVGGAAGVGASSAAATTVGEAQSLLGASNAGAASAVLEMGPASAGLSGAASGMQIYNAAMNHDEALDMHDKAQNIGLEGGGGAADLARFTATGVVNSQKLAGVAVSGAATAAAGVAGVVGGAAYAVGGAVGAYKHNKRKNNLKEIEKNAAGKDEKLELAANIGGSTQNMNRNKSAATSLKGAAMIIGGGLLLAGAATTPVGWILLGVAGAIGGIAAVYKFYKKRTRKEAIVDRLLGVDDKLAELAAENPKEKQDKSAIRTLLLQQNGYNNVGQCYNQVIADLAHTIYSRGVIGKEEQYVELLKNIGLEPNSVKRTPRPELIAKKLHS